MKKLIPYFLVICNLNFAVREGFADIYISGGRSPSTLEAGVEKYNERNKPRSANLLKISQTSFPEQEFSSIDDCIKEGLDQETDHWKSVTRIVSGGTWISPMTQDMKFIPPVYHFKLLDNIANIVNNNRGKYPEGYRSTKDLRKIFEHAWNTQDITPYYKTLSQLLKQHDIKIPSFSDAFPGIIKFKYFDDEEEYKEAMSLLNTLQKDLQARQIDTSSYEQRIEALQEQLESTKQKVPTQEEKASYRSITVEHFPDPRRRNEINRMFTHAPNIKTSADIEVLYKRFLNNEEQRLHKDTVKPLLYKYFGLTQEGAANKSKIKSMQKEIEQNELIICEQNRIHRVLTNLSKLIEDLKDKKAHNEAQGQIAIDKIPDIQALDTLFANSLFKLAYPDKSEEFLKHWNRLSFPETT